MKKNVIMSLALAGALALALASCTKDNSHEALTIVTSQTTDYSKFVNALHEEYPEINIDFISYKGANTTEYQRVLLKADDISDIFFTTYPTSEELQEERYIDIKGETFVTNYSLGALKKITHDDGGLYMLPVNMSLFGMYYNKTLFESHGWNVPNSLNELEVLIPQIEAAGVNLSETCLQYPGGAFAYFFDLAAGDYFTTTTGARWVKNFLNGDATASTNLNSACDIFKKYLDNKMITYNSTNDSTTKNRFKEGNTAFLISNSSMAFSNTRKIKDENGNVVEEVTDEYGIMPYLSKDGSKNTIITNVTSYVGISKKLEGNKQKLSDALKVLSFISTEKGQDSLNTRDNVINPLKDSKISEDSPLYEVSKLVNLNQSMELVYSGWEDYVVSMGNDILSIIKGEKTYNEFLTNIDNLKANLKANGGATGVARVEDDLNKSEVASLVGKAFISGTNADCALISVGDYHGAGKENSYGVNGNIYKSVTLTEDVVSTFNPLGWNSKINRIELTGKEIKEIYQRGYSIKGDDTPFEYVLTTKDGMSLDDDKTYIVAYVTISDLTDEQKEKVVVDYKNVYDSNGNIVYNEDGSEKKTEIKYIGQSILVEYLKSIGVINKDSVK